jgi:hypothetical protein
MITIYGNKIKNYKKIIIPIISIYLFFNLINCSSSIKLYSMSSLENIEREVDVSFVRFPGDSLSTLFLRLTTNEPHNTMFVNDINFIINDEKINIIKDKEITFKYSVGVMNGLSPNLEKINPSKYFGKMEINDEIIIKVYMQYSFDNNNIEIYEENKKVNFYREMNISEIFLEKIFSGFF